MKRQSRRTLCAAGLITAALAMINMMIIGVAIWLANWLGGGRLVSRGDAAPVNT